MSRAFLALPLAMVWIVAGSSCSSRYVPFVIVTNWISCRRPADALGPALLLLLGSATPGLSLLFASPSLVIVRCSGLPRR